MQIKKIEEDKQKIITISLIVSDWFCEEITPIFNENKDILYKTFDTFNKTIINWCIEYYAKYNKAPHGHIQDIYNNKKDFLKDEEQQLIKKFLLHLSNKYERDENYNESYVIDQAKLYIREVSLELLQKEVSVLKKEGKIDEAEHLILTYNKIDRKTEKRQTTNLFKDIKVAKEVCDFSLNQNVKDQLFKFPGDLGKFLEWIYREDFFIFAAYGKIGKSFHIREIALHIALNYGLNVFIFNLEMSHNKYLRNFYQNISSEVKYKKDKEILFPYFERQNDKYTIEYETLINKNGLSSKMIENKLKKVNMKTKGNIIVESFPSNTLTFQKCVKVLDDYVLKGLVCDVLLIDYLDNMKSFYKGDFRHGIDDKWVNVRRLAQEKHIAIGSVTHTNLSTLKGNVEPGKLSEENRKYNHITHGLGINQLPHEKRNQYSRLNIIANRDEDFDIEKFYVSLECKDLGKVMLDIKQLQDVIITDED